MITVQQCNGCCHYLLLIIVLEAHGHGFYRCILQYIGINWPILNLLQNNFTIKLFKSRKK